MTITVQQYRDINRDTTTPNDQIEYGISMAVGLLEPFLGRTLTHGTYTEALKVWPRGAMVYPRAVPITSVPASGTARIYDDATLYGATADIYESVGVLDTLVYNGFGLTGWVDGRGEGYEAEHPYATVTYTGGFTPTTLPKPLLYAIAKLAKGVITYDPAKDQVSAAGAKSARVGDVQVSYRDPTAASIDAFVPGLAGTLVGWKLDR